MILPFSTQLNGKPTNFVSKIWVGIESQFSEFNYKGNRLFNFPKEYIECGEKGLLTFQKPKPKLHTIREDKTDRWKAGNKIDFFINCRQKNMFRFAPRVPVVSIQKVEIKHTLSSSDTPLMYIEIDGKCLDTYNPALKLSSFGLIEKLAQNDGFDTVEAFFEYFNEDNVGKIIHWTDFRY